MKLIDRFRAAIHDAGPLTAADRPRWTAARTLPDLCDLTALWLSGDIDSQPSYYGRVDVDEDDAPGMTDALTACNRAGFLTYDSQAGFDGSGHDGAHWTLRAAVTGFAAGGTADRITEALAGTPFSVVTYPGSRGVAVTTRDGRTLTTYGTPLSRGEAAYLYDGCHPDAIAAVRDAVQVTVFDPRPGRNDLWPVLAEAVRGWSR